MANNEQDGNASWDGGCDMSRHPTAIAENQYQLGCNVYLPKSGGGISSRFGIGVEKLTLYLPVACLITLDTLLEDLIVILPILPSPLKFTDAFTTEGGAGDKLKMPFAPRLTL